MKLWVDRRKIKEQNLLPDTFLGYCAGVAGLFPIGSPHPIMANYGKNYF